MQMARLMSAVLKNAKTEKNREKKPSDLLTQTFFVVGNCVKCNQQKIVSECEPGIKKKNRGWSFLEAGHSLLGFHPEVKYIAVLVTSEGKRILQHSRQKSHFKAFLQ